MAGDILIPLRGARREYALLKAEMRGERRATVRLLKSLGVGRLLKGVKDSHGHEHGDDGKFTGSGGGGGHHAKVRAHLRATKTAPAWATPGDVARGAGVSRDEANDALKHLHETKWTPDTPEPDPAPSAAKSAAPAEYHPERVRQAVTGTLGQLRGALNALERGELSPADADRAVDRWRVKAGNAVKAEYRGVLDKITGQLTADFGAGATGTPEYAALRETVGRAAAAVANNLDHVADHARELIGGGDPADLKASIEAHPLQVSQTVALRERDGIDRAVAAARNAAGGNRDTHPVERYYKAAPADANDHYGDLYEALLAAVIEARETGDDDAVPHLVEAYREQIDGGDVIHKAGKWDSSKHPRDDSGRFLSKDAIADAKGDPEKEEALRDKVTDPEERAKLDNALAGTTDLGRTKKGEAKHQAKQRREKKAANHRAASEIADRIASGTATPEDMHDLGDHLEGLTLDKLRNLMAQIPTEGRGRRKAEVVAALKDSLEKAAHMKRVSAGAAAVDQRPEADTARLSLAGFLPNRYDVTTADGEVVPAGKGYQRYEGQGPAVGYTAEQAAKAAGGVTADHADRRIEQHEKAAQSPDLDDVQREYHAEQAAQLRAHKESVFGGGKPATPQPAAPEPAPAAAVAQDAPSEKRWAIHSLSPMTRAGRGMPSEGTLAEIKDAAKKKFGAAFHSVVQRNGQIEVYTIKNGYHGREKVLSVTYPTEAVTAAPPQAPAETASQQVASKEPASGDQKPAPWHGNREEVFSRMRQVDGLIQNEWKKAKELGPRGGSLSIGSADFDHTLKATVGEEYLRALRQGKTPQQALDAATAAGRDAVEKWNTRGVKGRVGVSGKHEMQRYEGAGDSYALGFHQMFNGLDAAFQPATPANPHAADEAELDRLSQSPTGGGKGSGSNGEDSAGAAMLGTGAGAKPVRFAAGKKLTPAERDEVIRSVRDAYREKGHKKDELKGYHRDSGDPIYGYSHAPEHFERSDITGAKIRHYVTLPDGRKAHPSELFPEIKQSDIDRHHGEQEAAVLDKEKRAKDKDARAAASKNDANAAYQVTRRPMEGSYLAEHPDGRIARVDGTDPEDVEHYQSRGFDPVTAPIAGQGQLPTPTPAAPSPGADPHAAAAAKIKGRVGGLTLMDDLKADYGHLSDEQFARGVESLADAGKVQLYGDESDVKLKNRGIPALSNGKRYNALSPRGELSAADLAAAFGGGTAGGDPDADQIADLNAQNADFLARRRGAGEAVPLSQRPTPTGPSSELARRAIEAARQKETAPVAKPTRGGFPGAGTTPDQIPVMSDADVKPGSGWEKTTDHAIYSTTQKSRAKAQQVAAELQHGGGSGSPFEYGVVKTAGGWAVWKRRHGRTAAPTPAPAASTLTPERAAAKIENDVSLTPASAEAHLSGLDAGGRATVLAGYGLPATATGADLHAAVAGGKEFDPGAKSGKAGERPTRRSVAKSQV